MMVTNASFRRPTNELRRGRETVGVTDRIYSVEGEYVCFKEVLICGDLEGRLDYNGWTLEIESVEAWIGMIVGPAGPRGPMLKNAKCRVIRE